MRWNVRVFEVPEGKASPGFAPPKELSPASVEARSTVHAYAALRSRFEGEGRRVRSINVGPRGTRGGVEFIVYLHGAK